jgi:hypothetical protein
MMRNWFQLLLVALLVLTPGAIANAQTGPEISFLEIDLWPEYDQPSMLVIYKITLAPTTALPAIFELRIPAEAGEPNAVAVIPPDGMPVNLEYELSSDGEWTTISLVANLFELQVEYYDPRLMINGKQRDFTYLWPGGHNVQRSLVQVLKPFDARDLTIMPGPTSQQGSGDQVFLVKDVGSLQASQSFEIEISYQKDSDELGISRLPVQPSEPLTSETDWQGRMLGALPWILGVGGVLLIAGGAIWYWQSGRQPQPSKNKRRRSRKIAGASEEAVANEGVYCHQCGKRAAAGDRFCRSCGTRLRAE